MFWIWTLACGAWAAASFLGALAVAAADPGAVSGGAAGPLVVGFERFHAQQPSAAGGRLLVSALQCAACHRAGGAVAAGGGVGVGRPAADGANAAAGLDVFKNDAPILLEAGRRLEPTFLQAWLTNPGAEKPGTRMPDVLASLDPQAKASVVRSLTHYLMSMTGEPTHREPEGHAPGDAARGARLYHATGCVACHAPGANSNRFVVGASDADEPGGAAPGEPSNVDPFDDAADLSVERPAIEIPSAPLGDLGGKYQPGALARFLLDPLHVRPGGRMPGMKLTAAEAADLEAYLRQAAAAADPTTDPKADRAKDPPFATDADLVRQGREAFHQYGCSACHRVKQSDATADGKQPAPHQGLASLRTLGGALRGDPEIGLAKGCLAPAPTGKAPRYSLTKVQRESIRLALAALGSSEPAHPMAPADRLDHELTALNCYACHERAGKGGPEPGRAVFFRTAGGVASADLGEEGRLPPHLTGVGRKLTTEAITDILAGDGDVRPYMATRMPQFGAANVAQLPALLGACDMKPGDERTAVVGRNRYGRALVGMDGFRCITCHTFAGRKSLGIPALDLTTAPKRLRPQWFREYLLDPLKFRPNTRMPNFFPKGRSTIRQVLGGNAEKQIDAIWIYLMEADQTRLPPGLEKEGAFELTPKDRPVLLRTFLEGAGTHAIAVGYPAGVHAAFDAKAVRWALAWRGRFLDAEATWDDRFTPWTKPLGEGVVRFAAAPSLAVLPSAEAAWPKKSLNHLQFLGYRLDGKGQPTFLYRLGGYDIADQLAPADDQGRWLRRTVTVTRRADGANGADGGEALWLRVATTGLRIRPVGGKDGQAGDRDETVVVIGEQRPEWRARVPFDGRRGVVVYDVSW